MRIGRLAWWLFLGGLVVMTGFYAYEAMLADETRIRRLLKRQVAAFNDCDLDCVAGLHTDFVDRPSGIGRDRLRAAMLYVFFHDVERSTGRFIWRIEAPDTGIEITDLDSDVGTAVAKFQVSLFRRSGDTESLAWELDVDAILVRTDRDGWQFRETQHRTISGQRPH